MLLCIDVGNTHLLGGVFSDEKLILRFRYATALLGTADQLGIFLVNILKFHHLDQETVEAIALSSVVPHYDYTLRHCFTQYFNQASYFFLQPEIKTGLNISCKNPNEIGADRIANAIGAASLFPNRSLIIVDMGTATTFCAMTEKSDYIGGPILPGMRLCMEALKNNTAKLMAVNIEVPVGYVGQNTRESIQSGLYYSHLGALKEIISGLKQEVFSGKSVKIIGTGGFAQLYDGKAIFDTLIPDLVLLGLRAAFKLNR